MKHRIYLRSALFLTFASLWATGMASWQCVVNDATNKEWLGESSYQRGSYNHALESCKKESTLPATCKPSSICGSLFTGLSARMMWQCSAVDHFANSWQSSTYSDRDSAALAAKAVCESHSKMPESCYTNLLTCQELRPVNPQTPPGVTS